MARILIFNNNGASLLTSTDCEPELVKIDRAGSRYKINCGQAELHISRAELDALLCRLIDPESKLL